MMVDEFEDRVAAALRAPVAVPEAVPEAVHAETRRRVMDRVRRIGADDRPRRARLFLAQGRFRASIAGAALAAGVGSLGVLPALTGGPRSATPGGRVSAVLGDSVGATLRDTMRLVRLMFVDSTAREVAVVGTFNGWRADSTPLAHDAVTHQWSATLAMRGGEHRYAFVVDGTRWAVDPSAPHARASDGRLVSLLRVAPVAN